MRGAGPIGDFGLCRAAFGTLVERLVRALAADRRAVRNCRVSLPCVTVSCTLIRQKARPLCCWAGLASQGTTGRVGRPDVSATPSVILHRLFESTLRVGLQPASTLPGRGTAGVCREEHGSSCWPWPGFGDGQRRRKAGKRWRVTTAARPAPPPPLSHRRLLSGVGPAR